MVVNPALSSASQLAQLANTPVQQEQNRISDKTSTNNTSGGSSTVTLSERAQKLSTDTTQETLAASQQVNNADSVENNPTESNQTTNGLTYGSSAQSKANYYAEVAAI